MGLHQICWRLRTGTRHISLLLSTLCSLASARRREVASCQNSANPLSNLVTVLLFSNGLAYAPNVAPSQTCVMKSLPVMGA